MKKKSIIIISIVIILGLGLLGFYLLQSGEKEGDSVIGDREKAEWDNKEKKLLNRITELEDEISSLSENNTTVRQPVVKEDDEGYLSQDEIPGEIPAEAVNIDDIELRIANFFLHLDGQEYIKKYSLKNRAYNEYEDVIERLSLKTPFITNETESLYNMFLNIAHFYRVIGKDRISLIRDVLANENDDIETLMRDFYHWYTHEFEKKKRKKGRPSPEVSYEYSVFFLNTIGGRNYLMRRNSKLRILAGYYSILFLDKANDLKLNVHGTDIRPYLRIIYDDISTFSGFKYQKEYTAQINLLKNKYNIE